MKFSAYAESEIKFALNAPQRISLRSNFTITEGYYFTRRKANFTEKRTLQNAKSFFLVEEGGFEPPKLEAADLQSVPFGHSGTPPYSE